MTIRATQDNSKKAFIISLQYNQRVPVGNRAGYKGGIQGSLNNNFVEMRCNVDI